MYSSILFTIYIYIDQNEQANPDIKYIIMDQLP